MPMWQSQLIAFGLIALSTGIRFLLQPLVHEGVPFVTYFPAIIIVGFFAGAWAGLTALVLATAAALIWLPPVKVFSLDAPSLARILAFWITGGLVLTTVYWLRSLVAILMQSEARANTLADEMAHRVENVLTIVIGISQQTARNAPTVSAYQMLFESRLAALENAQRLINTALDAPPDLYDLLNLILQPFAAQNVFMTGSKIAVPIDVAETLCLLIHELATNAMKHGSLSIPNGKVAINWHLDAGKLLLKWREINGPPVAEPVRIGFGSRLLRTAFADARGRVSISYEPSGVECTIEFLT